MGISPPNKNIGLTFLDNLKEGGYIDEEDYNTWKNPFSNETRQTETQAQVKSRFYYYFWGIATIAVVFGQLYVGTDTILHQDMRELLYKVDEFYYIKMK